MERILISGTEAREKVIEGVNKGANAAKSTLGPWGTNGLIEKGNRITNDGATILREITLEDEIENLGLTKLKEAVAKSNDQVGDGSTSIATLVQAILKEAQKNLGTSKTIGGKMSTAEFLREIKRESAEAIEKLQAMSKPISSKEELVRSAVVSVEDEALGELIGSTQYDLGEHGYILAEEVPERTTTIEMVHGVKIDNGLGASHLMNNVEKQMLEVDEVPVILTNYTIQSIKELEGILNQLITQQKKRKIAIIARGFSNEAIQDVGMNLKNGVEIYPINAPFTDSREIMLDLQSVLGGQFYDSEIHALEDMQLSDVGFAQKIRARRYDAIITGKNGSDTEKVQKRLATLRETLKGSGSDFEKKTLQARIAQLEHGFAVVKVGAESDTERKRIYDKVEDAVNAVRAALQEGTVPGAGLAFKEIAESLPDNAILKRPLNAIYEQIMLNAPEGFEVEDWVRDPVKVLRVVLEQAVSVAGDLATVSVVVATKKQKYNAFVPKGE